MSVLIQGFSHEATTPLNEAERPFKNKIVDNVAILKSLEDRSVCQNFDKKKEKLFSLLSSVSEAELKESIEFMDQLEMNTYRTKINAFCHANNPNEAAMEQKETAQIVTDVVHSIHTCFVAELIFAKHLKCCTDTGHLTISDELRHSYTSFIRQRILLQELEMTLRDVFHLSIRQMFPDSLHSVTEIFLDDWFNEYALLIEQKI